MRGAYPTLPKTDRWMSCCASSTDRTCLLNVVLFQGLGRAVYGVLLHVLGHVGILDNRFPFRHLAAVLRQCRRKKQLPEMKGLIDVISAAPSFVHQAAAGTKPSPAPTKPADSSQTFTNKVAQQQNMA